MAPRILQGPKIEPPFENLSLGEFFFTMSRQHGDKIAQIDSVTDQKESFNSVRRRSVRAAIEMSKRGISAKDVVIFCTNNSLDNIIPFLGATYLGAKVASLDPTLALSNIRHLLNSVRPSMIFVEDESISLIEQAVDILEKKPQIVVFGKWMEYPTLEDFTKAAENEDSFKPAHINPKDPAILFFSSGTTGLPKAVCLSSTNILFTIVGVDCKRDAVLHFTTLYWISGIIMLIASFFGGGYRVIVAQFDAEETFRIIEKYKVTYAMAAPVLTYKLTNLPNAGQYDTSSLDALLVGGSLISPTYLKKFRDVFKHADVVVGYGMTEIGFATCFQPKIHGKYIETKTKSCGKLTPGVVAKIVDIDTRKLLPPYQIGEICLKSPGLAIGYYNMDSSQAFDEDGFIKSGDIGYYDDDEFLYIVERIKEMFKYRSWHIVPSVIEIVLLEHPAIAEACVFGVPHEEDGDVPAAAVVLKDGKSATPEEIAEFVARKVLDRERLRAGVGIVEKLPKTPTGKLMRREARSQMIQSMSQHV